MNQAPDPTDNDARSSAHLQAGASSAGPAARAMQPQTTPSLPQLIQNAANLLDKNLFSVSTPNPLLPTPASLQLAQLQAQLTLHRLKLAQTAVTNNPAAATVLNQVLSKVAMSQPLFNQLRHPSMFNTPQRHTGGPGVANTRFPPTGIHFPTHNPTLAAPGGTLGPGSTLQSQNSNPVVINPFTGVMSQTTGQQAAVMDLNKTGMATATGGFCDYGKQVFPSDAEQCSQHGFLPSGCHSGTTSSGGGIYDSHYSKHDSQPGFQKEFYGASSKGQHARGVQSLSFSADPHNCRHFVSQKGEAGAGIHETESNNHWENSSTLSSQNNPDAMHSSGLWPTTSVSYEVRNELYNPEEPTPDTKLSTGGAQLAFSRTNTSKQIFSSSRMRQKQEPATAMLDLSVRPLQPHELNDLHSVAPICFPHICTICDQKVFDLKDWDQHIKGNLHIKKCMVFSEKTDTSGVFSSGNETLHSSSPSNMSGFNLSTSDDYPLTAASSFNSTSPFGQSGSTFSSLPSVVNLTQRKGTPGRVVHICNLPEGSCTENDVINLGLPFGKVTNYILMKSTNQAFLEMAYTEAAQAMVQYYKEKPAMINDDKLLIRMSKRYRELQLKKPGKNVAAIIQDIHSQMERDMLRETDRYEPERPRSRSPLNRPLSPRSHTPSFTSCSSPHSPLSTNRTDWGNGREPWDQSSYSRREEERDVMPWRENEDEKRDRTDTWISERKQHYLRHLDKLDLADRVEGVRGHREKYLRGGSPSVKGVHSLPGYKSKEEVYFRKPTKQKADKYQKQMMATAPKSKRKEDIKLRDRKHSLGEDPTKEKPSEQKPNKMPDSPRHKQNDKKKIKETAEEPEDEVAGATEEADEKKGKGTEDNAEKIDYIKENSPFPTNEEVKETEDSVKSSRKEKEEDWESENEMEAETWYPTNMEELVTVDEIGEDDLILEPDITELEEIVTIGQKDQECSQITPLAAGLKVNSEHNLFCSSEDKSNVMEANFGTIDENAGIISDSPDGAAAAAAIKASYLNLDTEQKPDELHEGRSLRDSDYQEDMEQKINESTDVCLKLEEQPMPSSEPKEEFFQQDSTFIDDYKEMESLEIESKKAMERLVKKSQEETSCGSNEHQNTQANCRHQEITTHDDYSGEDSKGTHFLPSWEQEDVFTELSIPLGVEFVVPRTGFYCKLCGLFYTNEESAKTRHCRSTVHYKNLQREESIISLEGKKLRQIHKQRAFALLNVVMDIMLFEQ